MIADFHHPPDRCGSDSAKWGKYAGRDILPLWVADMDFAAPPAVRTALEKRVAHGVFGYGAPWPALTESVLAYLENAYDWRVQPAWLVWLPGLVTGINIAVRSVCNGTDDPAGVLTSVPAYPPFLAAPKHGGQPLRTVALQQTEDGRWRMDIAALEAACVPGTKLLLLCHPHNPVGRCWSRAELEQIADFAARRDLVVCSDEIHCDLILDEDKRHLPFALLGEAAAARSITLMAPSKTFNIPGLACALAIIPDARLRQCFLRVMQGIVPHVNVLALAACEAAFRDCARWHQDLLCLLRQNRDRLEAAVACLPGLSMSHVEATYLAWIDARALASVLPLPDDLSPAAYFETCGLGFSDGADFGAPGWVRFNFGCAPELLERALARLRHAVENPVIPART
ncbi:MAG: PatB family C-S lyase [Zoogloeaceae bacterium]|jgi:cystathionine beta-lyase|nr:PatB family C-S lyase [Zoogloeaceae bacterium]